MASTEIPIHETEKQHLGMVEVRLDTQEVYVKSQEGHPVQPSYLEQNGHPLQNGHPQQQNNASSGSPPSYSQITNHFQSPPQPQSQTKVINTAPRSRTAFSGRPRPQVQDYSRLAIAVTLCCCLPFGLIGYFMASRAKDKQLYGDDDGALTSSRCALGWSIAGIVCGGVLLTFLGIYYFSLISFFNG